MQVNINNMKKNDGLKYPLISAQPRDIAPYDRDSEDESGNDLPSPYPIKYDLSGGGLKESQDSQAGCRLAG